MIRLVDSGAIQSLAKDWIWAIGSLAQNEQMA
jgi:hypothetical protein